MSSELRHKALLSTLLKAGNIDEEAKTWLDFCYHFIKTKYSKLTPEQLKSVFAEYGGDKYLDRIKRLYDISFSEQEIEEITKFWLSPIGHKLVKGKFRETQINFGITWAETLEKACQNILKEKI